MTPERLAKIEQQHRRDMGSIPLDECLRRGCLTCLLSTALRAAWGERDERRAEAEGLRDRVVDVVGERDTLRVAIMRFVGVLVTDSRAVMSRRVIDAADALVAVATGETPAAEEAHDG